MGVAICLLNRKKEGKEENIIQNMRRTHSLLVLVVASACVEAGPVRCLLDRVVTRTRFEEGHIVEIARQLECGHQERDAEEENYRSDEEDYNSDEDEDSDEDDYRDKAESEGSSSTSTTSAASTTHAAAA